MTDNLSPCPFCGGADIRIDAHRHAGRGEHQGETIYSMGCYGCGATFPNRYRKELLIEAWNRRVVLPDCNACRDSLLERQPDGKGGYAVVSCSVCVPGPEARNFMRRNMFPGGRAPAHGIDLREFSFRGDVSPEAREEIQREEQRAVQGTFGGKK